MLLSFITPTKYIQDYQAQGDFILALSHLFEFDKMNDYKRAILRTKLPIILDNGCFENGRPENPNSLILKAASVGAGMVVAPDTLYNAEKTIEGFSEMTKVMDRSGTNISLMVVCQARNKEEYLDFYKNLCLDPQVDMIGLSILAIPYVYKKSITRSRIALMKDLLRLKIEHKKCHLLGLGDGYEDVVFAQKNCPWIVSNDSSSAFWNGVQGKAISGSKLEVEGGKTEIVVDFNYKDASLSQLKLIQSNINKIKNKLCK